LINIFKFFIQSLLLVQSGLDYRSGFKTPSNQSSRPQSKCQGENM